MTKKERATVQRFINNLTELSNIKDETLKTLQDLNEEHGDGHRWCSWQACLDGILANSQTDDVVKSWAKYHYERFVKATAQEDLIRDFGASLAEVGFWK